MLREALAELLQLSLGVVRVTARLLDVEGGALAVLAENAVQAARNVAATQDSLAEAIQAGQMADASDVAREAIAARIVGIAKAHEKADRSVRRTVALIMRIDEGRPLRQPRAPLPGLGSAKASDLADPPERRAAEPRDEHEWDDELGGMTTEQAIRAVCRDVGADPAPFLAPLYRTPMPVAPRVAPSMPASVTPLPTLTIAARDPGLPAPSPPDG